MDNRSGISTLWIQPGGHNIYFFGDRNELGVGKVDGYHITICPTVESYTDDLLLGSPWRSSRGYRAARDWWILGPDGRRLLMLPSAWQSGMGRQIWNGQFVALVHGTLPEPVILDLGL